MESYERKLAPDVLRWVLQNPAGERTVMVRLAYSQDPDEAAETIESRGMVVQSSGPGLVIASTNCDAVMQVAELSWVVKIDLPQRLDLKNPLGNF